MQADYWHKIRQSSWSEYQTVATLQGADAIIEHILVEFPDFDDLEGLTKQLQNGTKRFIEAIEKYLLTIG